jgi:hypothetical protein
VGAIDLAHAAGAKRADDSVVTDVAARRKGHSGDAGILPELAHQPADLQDDTQAAARDRDFEQAGLTG